MKERTRERWQERERYKDDVWGEEQEKKQQNRGSMISK